SYEHGFAKKNTTIINFAQIKFRSIFCSLYQNFKILFIPNVLAHGKTYEHGFAKKCDSRKLCTMSRRKSSDDHFSRTISKF
ncbi:hypothetical protein BHM03_00023824, partial [Ensete ventricosum]